MDVGFAVWKVPDGTSAAQVREEGISEIVERGHAETFVFSEVTEEGTERMMSITLDIAGTWLVHCFDLSSPEGDVFLATTFEVVEKS